MDRVKIHDKEIPDLTDMNGLSEEAETGDKVILKRLMAGYDMVCMGLDVGETTPASLGVKIGLDAVRSYGLALSEEGEFILLTAEETQPISTPDGANPRVDVLLIKEDHEDAEEDYRYFRTAGSGIEQQLVKTREAHSFAISVVEGIPGSSPVAPATPAGYVKLAEITVPALATEIVNANIKDVDDAATWTTDVNGTVRRRTFFDHLDQDATAETVHGVKVGNATGNVPISNGTVNTNLSADKVDGYHAGNLSGRVPISNGAVNTNLNADKLDGYHAANSASSIPVLDGSADLPLAQIPDTLTGKDADTVDGYHGDDIMSMIFF